MGQNWDSGQWCPPSPSSSWPERPTRDRAPAATSPLPLPPGRGSWEGWWMVVQTTLQDLSPLRLLSVPASRRWLSYGLGRWRRHLSLPPPHSGPGVHPVNGRQFLLSQLISWLRHLTCLQGFSWLPSLDAVFTVAELLFLHSIIPVNNCHWHITECLGNHLSGQILLFLTGTSSLAISSSIRGRPELGRNKGFEDPWWRS